MPNTLNEDLFPYDPLKHKVDSNLGDCRQKDNFIDHEIPLCCAHRNYNYNIIVPCPLGAKSSDFASNIIDSSLGIASDHGFVVVLVVSFIGARFLRS